MFSKLQSYVTSVEDSICVGYPLKHKIGHSVDQVKVLIWEYRRIIVCDVANMWISFGSADLILKKDSLNMWFTTIFVPPLLCVNFGQKPKKKKKNVISFPPSLTDLVPCEFSFSITQDCINGEILWYYHDFRKITGCICLVSNNALLNML